MIHQIQDQRPHGVKSRYGYNVAAATLATASPLFGAHAAGWNLCTNAKSGAKEESETCAGTGTFSRATPTFLAAAFGRAFGRAFSRAFG
jgi:hypothetical protein